MKKLIIFFICIMLLAGCNSDEDNELLTRSFVMNAVKPIEIYDKTEEDENDSYKRLSIEFKFYKDGKLLDLSDDIYSVIKCKNRFSLCFYGADEGDISKISGGYLKIPEEWDSVYDRWNSFSISESDIKRKDFKKLESFRINPGYEEYKFLYLTYEMKFTDMANITGDSIFVKTFYYKVLENVNKIIISFFDEKSDYFEIEMQ